MDLIAKLGAAVSRVVGTRLVTEPWTESVLDEFDADYARSYAQPRADFNFPKVKNLPCIAAILARSPRERGELAAAALARIVALHKQKRQEDWSHQYGLADLFKRLARAPLDLSDDRLGLVVDFYAAHTEALAYASVPLLIGQVERRAGGKPISAALASALRRLVESVDAARSRNYSNPDAKLRSRVERLIAGDEAPAPALHPSPWREWLLAHLAGLAVDEALTAQSTLDLALRASKKGKPSAAFLKEAGALLAETPSAAGHAANWIEACRPDQRDANEDVVRALIWLLGASSDPMITARLGAFATRCLTKVPYYGTPSFKLGNAALVTLSTAATPDAIAVLTRLKRTLRAASTAQKIEAALGAAAERLNITADELEEMVVPTHELTAAGERRITVGPGAALLRIVGSRVELSWETGDGRQAASAPKAMKDADPAAVKAVAKQQKEIAASLAAQTARLEGLYLADRRIPMAQWRTRYLEHPLLGRLTRRLIWTFQGPNGKRQIGLPTEADILDVHGLPLDIASDAVAFLWHPVEATADEVLAWRNRIVALGITQPFKQAHREIYVLTDAERQTETYSNRYAAHILRQHQFKALCDQRSWRFSLMGAWDSHNTPTRRLARHGLSIEFWVDQLPDAETSTAAVFTAIATDQVRFCDETQTPLPLARIAPIVFSEVMREVDLFVGVASIGNDPNWVDGGATQRYGAYWREYAKAELTASGQGRAQFLQSLLPRLHIAERCSIDDRYLTVRGVLRTYKIHLGSANILMAPNDRYLCIVPGRGPAQGDKNGASLILPFEGDRTLSIILSKAFLLAADDQIKDPSIVNQIRSP